MSIITASSPTHPLQHSTHSNPNTTTHPSKLHLQATYNMRFSSAFFVAAVVAPILAAPAPIPEPEADISEVVSEEILPITYH